MVGTVLRSPIAGTSRLLKELLESWPEASMLYMPELAMGWKRSAESASDTAACQHPTDNTHPAPAHLGSQGLLPADQGSAANPADCVARCQARERDGGRQGEGRTWLPPKASR